MFVSHDKSINKKKFQKPNILRRKSKAPSVKLSITSGSCESPEQKSLISPININESTICDVHEEKVPKRRGINTVQSVKKVLLKTNVDYSCPYEVQISEVEENEIDVDTSSYQNFGNKPEICSHEETGNQNVLNVESFLVSDTEGKNISLLENDMYQLKSTDIQVGQKWCLELNNDFSDDTQKIILQQCEGSQLEEVYLEQKSDFITTMVPLSAVSAVQQNGSYILSEEQTSDNHTVQNISVDHYFSRSHKFKCDVPECDKEFMSEQKLKKHKNIHNKDGNTSRVPKQTECPVKNILEDGTEEPCGMIFQMRDELMKHLNENHKPEDALYRCEECGRRFFWASGLRAHGRAHRSRRPRLSLACVWPGCGRVFRQPCRLREHTRAHTGDKPYPCQYPNCGWSFRTASKLVRHARRHTGERRHACASCGRAFLRREHLRDHAARHHSATRLHCAHQGCEQSFTNMNSLYTHMKKVHGNEEEKPVEDTVEAVDTQSILKTDSGNIFMVTYMPETTDMETATKNDVKPESFAVSLNASAAVEVDDSADESEAVVGGMGGAARTHCTWPLPRSRPFVPDTYVLEDDAQVEHSQITVRSDLFLHGNVLTNEDSEHMGGARAGCGAALDAELLLAPSVALAQEELYTDAVDESAFRVFLLSGEDLT